MDFEYIEKLIKLIDKSQLREFEIDEDGLRIYMSKNENRLVESPEKVTYKEKTSCEGLSNNKEVMNEEKNELEEIEVSKKEVMNEDVYIVKSPIVGTFYTSANEGGAPYVKVGDKVTEGKVLCIVEAMKLMNEIECEVTGMISEVFVSNGDLVEYGQPIMAIKL